MPVGCLAAAAQEWLITFPDVVASVGAFPADDPIAENAGQPFIFAENLFIDIRTYPGTIAVVLTDIGGWQAPIALNSFRFRRLRLDIYADPLRDDAGNVIESSTMTEDRALGTFVAFNSHLHRKDPDAIVWGDELVTLQCQLITEPDFVQWPVASGSGITTQLGSAVYGVTFSGWLDVAA